MMDELVKQLHDGNHSCVIANLGLVRAFDSKGVADLYDLLTHEPEFLCGAYVADKVVGKGAAALMVLGKVHTLHTDIISTSALELLCRSDVAVGYGEEVPFIWNRDHTGHCPVETLCEGVETVEEMWPLISHFVQEMRSRKKS